MPQRNEASAYLLSLKVSLYERMDLKEERHEPGAKNDILTVSMGGLETSDFMAEGARQVYKSAIEAGGEMIKDFHLSGDPQWLQL